MLGPTFSDRTTSGFALSISTAYAMESIFAPKEPVLYPDREAPPKIALSKYQEIWINIETLFRNLIQASDKKILENARAKDIADALEQEIEIISSLFAHEGNNVCQPRFYTCDYSKVLFGLHSSFALRGDNTEPQRLLTMMFKQAINLMTRKTDTIYEFASEIKPPHKDSALILTHYPYDLLSASNFHTLHLLESNTGKLKTKRQWNSKYYPVGQANMSHLPFMKMLLMVFGDKVLIQPSVFKLRQQIIDISIARGWTPMSTQDKVLLDLELDIKEVFVMQVMRSAR